MAKNTEKVTREFKLTNLALKNKNTVYLIIVSIFAFGLLSYIRLPKELTPEIDFPTILVQTIYPGNPPEDIENLITRPLEKEVETVKGIKELRSTSAQDYSTLIVEFNTDINIEDALKDVKDAVDKAKGELPNDLLEDPQVMDIDFSEFPVINLNLSGDFSILELKEHAEYLEDKIEEIFEVSKVEIRGIDEREIKINVDKHLMESNKISFNDIENAIAFENVSMSAGELKLNGTIMSMRILGEFERADEIGEIVVKSENSNIVHLKDIAEIVNGYADPSSIARLDKHPVVSLQVIKKSGENILETTKQIFEVVDEAREANMIPENLHLDYTNDMSNMVRKQLNNLENSIIMGVLLVILILFFFLGTRNSLLVGLAIPMSMFLSFMIIGAIDFRINMIVLFALILALGMLVDNAIVTVENIFRFRDQGYKLMKSARLAVGEIAMPIISSTATTLAAFFPLVFWDSIEGEFMKYLPITLIIVLTSSLFVALVIIPVLSTIGLRDKKDKKENVKRKRILYFSIAAGLAMIFYIAGVFIVANLITVGILIGILNIFFLKRSADWFQNVFLIKLEALYERLLRFALRKMNYLIFIGATNVLLIGTFVFYFSSDPDILYFPDNDPKYVNVLAELPIGTDIRETDKFMHQLEDDLSGVLAKYDSLNVVESILTNVGTGSNSENDFFGFGETPHKGRTTITFVDHELRDGVNTSEIMKDISDEVIGKYPGVIISIEKNSMGPPTGRPINIEISGKEFDELLEVTDQVESFIESQNIEGIEGFKIDLDVGKPEVQVLIKREEARRFGLSTMQIAGTIRTALFGKEISDFKEGEEEFPIQLRLKESDRYDVSSLMNQLITFRSAATGQIIQVPISAVADIKYSSTYGAIKRKDLDRVITLYSNVIEGYNANNVNEQIKQALVNFEIPEGYTYAFTGEQEDQAESARFLMSAMLIAVSLILIILVSQFNSIVKPFIIIGSVIFSTIGVFGGLGTFNMDFVMMMTGVGIVSLAGVVVNNAIVLIDYIDLLKKRKRAELEIPENAVLSVHDSLDCIIRAGKTRLRPVLLTAITTVLGLIPLATGMNINFGTLLSEFDAQLSFGGDMVAFWGPISWTVIFGLSFATFLTLVIVPAMYHAFYLVKLRVYGKYKYKQQ